MIADCQMQSGHCSNRRANRSPPQPHVGWPTLIAVLVVSFYFLVAHGCHGDDVDHELLLVPLNHHAEQIEGSK
jgi:hypothetical protein